MADNAVDFMVMGGYGHSRLREFALGGHPRHSPDHDGASPDGA
jgi:nucleotide-binding universal stress UspA family protein